ncbi:hypothetical protein [Sandaracinus amylolyticus]|uniref:Uncharacterized protein n=1 Tax=Sandaracinus amylolyticus TaxID=927083 RepID=A0A0F6W411_9BACT|nr:hypothetical protein [Sandaracinus amylolyticus]AKF06937.1 hypothetical protein DB32_004086 [Sandaracinus amylolyticus]
MCGVDLAVGWARPRASLVPRGLGRAARVVALGITVSACGARTDLGSEDASARDDAAQREDAATPVADAGTPRDAGRDAGVDAGDIPIPLYGAPPVRDLPEQAIATIPPEAARPRDDEADERA